MRFPLGFLVLAFVICTQARAENDTPLNVEILKDPLHPGSAFLLTIGRQTANNNALTLQGQITHTFDDVFNVGFTVPVVLSNEYAQAGAQSPYLGGGFYNRLYISGIARLLGNERRYLDLGSVVGLPYQSASALQNSVYNSWLIGGTLTGHYRISRVALEVSITDFDSFPNQVESKTGVYTFRDSINEVFWSMEVFYFVVSRFDLSFGYREIAPSDTNVGTNVPTTFIVADTKIARLRSFSIGFDWSLDPSRLLLVFNVSYNALGGPDSQGDIISTGILKWIF